MISLFAASALHGGNIDGLKCGTNISELPQLEIEYIMYSYVLYKDEHNSTTFGSVEPISASYFFSGDRFVVKVYSITGRDNINEVLRYFTKRLEQYNNQKPEKIITPIPMERKDGSWLFVEKERAIIIRRFSHNLGQVSILCRDMWEEYMGISEKIEKK